MGSGKGLRISLGVIAGLPLGFFCYLPAVILWQHYGCSAGRVEVPGGGQVKVDLAQFS